MSDIFDIHYWQQRTDRVAINLHENKVGRFASARDAQTEGNSWYIPGGFATFYFATHMCPDYALANIHDVLLPKQPVDFQDRETAAREVWQLLHNLEIGRIIDMPTPKKNAKTSTVADKPLNTKLGAQATKQVELKNAAAAAATATKTAPAPAAKPKPAPATKKAAAKKAPTNGHTGRASMFAGKVLLPAKGMKKEGGKLLNPRRPGTAGNTQLQWIIDAAEKGGILYEDWVKKGGLPINLRHDVTQEWVKFEAPKAK